MRRLAAAIAVFAWTDMAIAQSNVTTDDIVQSLGGGAAQPAQPSRPSEAPPSRQNEVTTDDIVSTLGGGSPRPATRALGDDEFKQMKTRSIGARGFNIKDLEKVEQVSQERPKISLEVYFDYNSADITPQARGTLDKLGSALEDPRLAGKRFFFNGHTDARGDPYYNQELSQRRAASALRYIAAHYRVDERNIIASGHGARVPKNPANPYADENRRVEVAREN
jgi:outer membrane protein OmpA-like peptidoglycan-associated protein